MKVPSRAQAALPALAVSIAFVLSACAGSGQPPSATPQPSDMPSPTPSQAPSSETPHPTPSPSNPPASPEPSDEPDATGDLAWTDQLRILVDGLAVRRGPHSSSPLLRAMVWNDAQQGWETTDDEVRLNAGHLVTVSLGPIQEDGITWYRVFSYPQGDQDASDEIQWEADDDGVPDEGWIAVANDGQPYAERLDVEPDPHQGQRPLVFAHGGSGTFESEPFHASYQVAGNVALLVSGGVAPCELEVTLEPTGETMFSTSLQGVYTVEQVYSSMTEASPEGEYRVRVSAGVDGNPDAECGWALSLFQAQG